MPRTEEIARLYENLALQFDRQREPRMRDWFLLLAADAAQAAGNSTEAERIRGLLLSRNPYHLISPFASFAEALLSPDIKTILTDLRRKFPPSVAEQMWTQQRPSEPVLEFDAEQAPPNPAPADPPLPVDEPTEVILPAELSLPPVRNEAPEPAATPRSRGKPAEEETEVYQLQSDALPAASPRSAVPQERTTASRPTPGVAKSPAPSTAPATSVPAAFPVLPATAPFPGYEPAPRPRRSRRAVDEGNEAANRWVARVLAILATVLGVIWLGYTAARPFLPPEWFR